MGFVAGPEWGSAALGVEVPRAGAETGRTLGGLSTRRPLPPSHKTEVLHCHRPAPLPSHQAEGAG